MYIIIPESNSAKDLTYDNTFIHESRDLKQNEPCGVLTILLREDTPATPPWNLRKIVIYFQANVNQKRIRSCKRTNPLMPAAGIEPARYCYHGILSPARLPIPSRRHMIYANPPKPSQAKYCRQRPVRDTNPEPPP